MDLSQNPVFNELGKYAQDAFSHVNAVSERAFDFEKPFIDGHYAYAPHVNKVYAVKYTGGNFEELLTFVTSVSENAGVYGTLEDTDSITVTDPQSGTNLTLLPGDYVIAAVGGVHMYRMEAALFEGLFEHVIN